MKYQHKDKYIHTVSSLASKPYNEWIDSAVSHRKANFPDMSKAASGLELYDGVATDRCTAMSACFVVPNQGPVFVTSKWGASG